jgi:hypothetical protein
MNPEINKIWKQPITPVPDQAPALVLRCRGEGAFCINTVTILRSLDPETLGAGEIMRYGFNDQED